MNRKSEFHDSEEAVMPEHISRKSESYDSEEGVMPEHIHHGSQLEESEEDGPKYLHHEFSARCLLDARVHPDVVSGIVEAVEGGRCPRCRRDPVTYDPHGPRMSRVTRCMHVPICDFCWLTEFAVIVPVERWAASPLGDHFYDPEWVESGLSWWIREAKRITDATRQKVEFGDWGDANIDFRPWQMPLLPLEGGWDPADEFR